jgi:hypothetical protein
LPLTVLNFDEPALLATNIYSVIVNVDVCYVLRSCRLQRRCVTRYSCYCWVRLCVTGVSHAIAAETRLKILHSNFKPSGFEVATRVRTAVNVLIIDSVERPIHHVDRD